MVGIVMSQNALQRIFAGGELGPERMFEAYSSCEGLQLPRQEIAGRTQRTVDEMLRGLGSG